MLEASTGERALALFSEHSDISLVVTDQAMPGMTGTQMAELMSDIRPNIPMILATGYGELPTGFRKGVVKLGKPFNQAALEEALSEAMSLSRS